MLKTPYTKNDRTYANDLKIFIGKRSEITELEIKDQLVNRKWYLAWDTGEFFIANSMRKLVRYGGSAKTLSESDVEEIIKKYTKSDLDLLRSQLVTILDQYKDVNLKMRDIKNEFNNTVHHLETSTIEYLTIKINEILNNTDIINFYTKNQTDRLIETSENNTKQYVTDTCVTLNELTNYVTKDESNKLVSNKLTFSSGDNLEALINLKTNGYYFCISNSSIENFEIGHTYYLHNGLYEDITAAGSGPGYTTPSLNLTLKGQTKIIREICSDFVDDLNFVYTITNPKDIKENLSFYENTVKIDTISLKPISYGDFHYTATLTNLNIGEYKYTIAGMDKKNNLISADMILKVIAPIYFGTTEKLMPSADAIVASNKKLAESATGKYTFTTKSGEYIFIAMPEPLTIKKVSMNGFTIPMTNGEQVFLQLGDYQIIYNYYRSKTAASAEIFTVDII